MPVLENTWKDHWKWLLSTQRCCWSLFIEIFCFMFTTLWDPISNAFSNRPILEYTYVYLLLMKMCELRILYYIFCLAVLHSQMETIDQEIKKNKNNHSFWIKSYGFQEIRKNSTCIYEMTNCLNKVFGLSQVAAICYGFYMVPTNLNWVYTHFEEILPKFNMSKALWNKNPQLKMIDWPTNQS